jgi:hypothetical protein
MMLGTFSSEATVPLAAVPLDAERGTFVRAVWISADALKGDRTAYWTLTFGDWSNGAFHAQKTLAYGDGFPGNPVRVPFSPELSVPRGSLLALRVTPTSSAAAPLTRLAVILETAIAGARAR